MSQFGTSGGGGGGSIVTSITGNTGGPQTGDINLITAHSTPIFAGSGGTITLDFALTTNLLLGSSGSITSGQQNVSVGAFSQGSVTSGDTNSSLGVFSLLQLKTGFDNLALGNRAGFNLSTNESRNILLANDGVAAESNAIRIGTRPYQTTAYIAGIDGVDLSTATIVTESADQLGTAVLTAGSGITITPGAGVITIDATGGAGITTLVADDGASSSGAVINLIGFDGIHTQSNAAANFNFILRAPGTRNLYLGEGAGITGTSAGANICLGAFSMTSISGGSENIICGDSAARALVSGAGNSSFGCVSMPSVVSGNYNTNLGFEAGFNNTGSDSSNINIGYTANGSAGVSNRLMIGGGTGAADGQLSSAFISGIDGVNVGSVATVVTESGNQLGTAVLTAGSGITITPGANTITIDATGGGGAGTITGNTGGAQAQSAGNWDIKTANSTVLFDGAASTLTLDFSPTNLMLGSSGVSITTAVRNTAGGLLSGDSLVDGTDNTFWGDEAGRSATDSSYNVAIGGQALLNVGASATNNTAIGYLALSTAPDSIVNNVAVGSYALYQLGSGASSNVAIGVSAGVNFTSTESNNICIQNQGFAADNGVIRIGSNGNHTTCFVAGINGNDLSTANVVTESGDQLGTTTLIGGSGITITPGAGTLTIDATGGGPIPAFQGIRTATLANATGAGTGVDPIPYDTIVFDTTSSFDGQYFSAPTTGIYLFVFELYLGGLALANNFAFAQVRVTGASAQTYQVDLMNPYTNGYDGGGNYVRIYTVMAQMTAGDIAHTLVRVFGGGSDDVDLLGLTDTGGSATSFSGYLIV